MKLLTFILLAAVSLTAGLVAPSSAWADDIDIFTGSVSQVASAPNVIFLIDNDSNFAAANQKIPGIGQTSCSSCPKVGQSEVDAIVRVMASLYNAGSHVNVGVALLNSELGSPSSALHSTLCNGSDSAHPGDGNGTCNSGAFMRYGARDMADLTNFTALAKILGWSTAPAPLTGSPNSLSIYSNLTSPSEKINSSIKDNAESYYELLQYLQSTSSSNQPAFGGVVTGSVNAYADFNGNNVFETPKGQGLGTPYALTNSGNKYVGPPNSTGCAKNYIIHITNPDQSNSFNLGHQRYANSANFPASFVATTGGANSWVPAWTQFLASKQITTYVVNVYQASAPSASSEAVSMNEAQQGGGKYYVAKSGDDILKDITKILIEIQSVNSAFAATALPASATNRGIDQNQVYLGVFRPDPVAQPRWLGNLKRFQIVLNNNAPDLGDALGAIATSSTTGFITDCAASYWTKDTSAYRPDGAGLAPTDPAYWQNVASNPVPLSKCPGPADTDGWKLNPANVAVSKSYTQFQPASGITWQPKSDSPDGPFVEKGGAAEVLRRGNVPVATSDTWQQNRNMFTMNSGNTAFTAFDYTTAQSRLTSAGGVPSASGPAVADWVLGWDSLNENPNPGFATQYKDPHVGSSTTNETRPSIHGDVIHSTPLPITYNSSASGVAVYYGSNDGVLHATNANTGVEIWSFIAPEFIPNMYRLYNNSPIVAYPGISLAAVVPTPTRKDYGFDGSAGLYQAFNSAGNLTTAYIYPTMRRGGRMVYAINVSPSSAGGNPPSTPTFLWSAGCPHLGDDSGCTNTMSGIGQTWSKPQIGVIKNGSSDNSPKSMVVFGGGYDSTQTSQTITPLDGVTPASSVVVRTSCEDENVKAPTCSNRKGAAVYVIDAQSGPSQLLSVIPLPAASGDGAHTSRAPGSVVGDVALLDFDGDGVIDYAYVADTTGSVYRIDFVDRVGSTPAGVLSSSNWASHIHRVAFTNDSNNPRKFLFGPVLLVNQGTAAKPLVYVGLGSGDREHPLSSQYAYSSPVQNRFYLFLDDPTTSGAGADKPLDLDRGSTIGSVNHSMENSVTVSSGTATFAECPNDASDPTSTHNPVHPSVDTAHLGVTPNTFPTPSGWFMDLVNDQIDTTLPVPVNNNGAGGEQTVTPAVIVGGQLTWGTNLPNPHVSDAACSNSLGRAYGYLVNLLNGSPAIGTTGTCGGTSVSSPYTNGGLPLPPTVGTVGITDSNGDTNYVPICIGCPPKEGGGSAGPAPQNVFPTSGEKRTRVYWFTPNYN
jgi:type IV pilus assembly protein PilY1